MKLASRHTLLCPLDGHPLVRTTRQFLCPLGHNFDRARQGYINLLPVQSKKSKSPGDSPEMVAARRLFLQTGGYDRIASTLIDLVSASLPASTASVSILDAGCGEGFYLGRLASHLSLLGGVGEAHLVGVDISKPAIIAAAKRYREIDWVVASNHQGLVPDHSLDAVLCLFGFPCFERFKEALKAGGTMILVDAGPDHLIELRRLIYPSVRYKPLPCIAEAISLGFELAKTQTLRYPLHLSSQESIDSLMLMTPHFFKASRIGRQAITNLGHLTVTVDVRFRQLSIEDK